MNSFCTYFDRNCVIQALALFDSLKRNSQDPRLYVICLDEYALDLLRSMDIPGIIPLPEAEIEDEELREVKARIGRWQYYGVIQPLVCMHILKKFKPVSLTYVETDMYFFSSVEPLFWEMAGAISIVPHRFHPGHERTAGSGKFCTQFNTFYDDEASFRVLEYWKDQSFKYDKRKPDEYPGQLSLDKWQSISSGVKVIENIGAGVAPWNIDNYEVSTIDGIPCVNGVKIIFYHFHQFGWLKNGSYRFCSYELPEKAKELIYKPYVEALDKALGQIMEFDPGFAHRKFVEDIGVSRRLAARFLPCNIKSYLKRLLAR